jgi:hypothetical protein
MPKPDHKFPQTNDSSTLWDMVGIITLVKSELLRAPVDLTRISKRRTGIYLDVVYIQSEYLLLTTDPSSHKRLRFVLINL